MEKIKLKNIQYHTSFISLIIVVILIFLYRGFDVYKSINKHTDELLQQKAQTINVDFNNAIAAIAKDMAYILNFVKDHLGEKALIQNILKSFPINHSSILTSIAWVDDKNHVVNSDGRNHVDYKIVNFNFPSNVGSSLIRNGRQFRLQISDHPQVDISTNRQIIISRMVLSGNSGKYMGHLMGVIDTARLISQLKKHAIGIGTNIALTTKDNVYFYSNLSKNFFLRNESKYSKIIDKLNYKIIIQLDDNSIRQLIYEEFAKNAIGGLILIVLIVFTWHQTTNRYKKSNQIALENLKMLKEDDVDFEIENPIFTQNKKNWNEIKNISGKNQKLDQHNNDPGKQNQKK